MRRLTIVALALASTTCTEPLLPDSAVAELGKQMCQLGHPNATCGEGSVSRQSHGPLSLSKTKERWVEVSVPYERKGKNHTMTVRILVKQLVPCTVSSNVVADDGPNPILLDNPVSSKLVGDAICKELSMK